MRSCVLVASRSRDESCHAVRTLADRTEKGWIAGFDAFEHAIVLIDGETSLRSFHSSKVTRIEAQPSPRTVVITIEHDVVWNTWRVSDDGGRFEPRTFYGSPEAATEQNARHDRYVAENENATVKVRVVRIEERTL